MKKIFYLSCVLSLALFYGCDKEDPENDKPEIDIPASVTDLPAFTGKKAVTFTTTTNWKIDINETKSPGWCRVEPMSGAAGEATIQITADPNDTFDDRSAEIVIKAGNTTKKITVSQKRKNELAVSEKRFDDFSGMGGTLEIDVTSNLDYEVIIPDEYKEWIIPVTGKAVATNTLSFNIVASDLPERREGEIIVKDKNSIQADTTFIVQLAQGTVRIDLETPGTLKDQDLNGITTLILIGEPNDDDYKTLKEQAPELEKLDMRLCPITVIPNYAFDRQNASKALTSILLPSGITAIGNFAFSLSGITELYFPENLESIGESAFAGSNLTVAELPASVKTIGAGAFVSAFRLTQITLPEGVSIERMTFYGCPLSSVFIPKDALLDVGAFAYSNVKAVTFSEGCASTGIQAFNNCEELESVTFNGKTAIESGAFSGCKSLKAVNMQNGSGEIGMSAFGGCSSLETIVIGNGVSQIESGTFASCTSLKSVTLPRSVTAVHPGAFYSNCTALVLIRCEAVNPPFINEFAPMFIGFDVESATLEVPAGSKALYQNAGGWNEFGTITEYALP